MDEQKERVRYLLDRGFHLKGPGGMRYCKCDMGGYLYHGPFDSYREKTFDKLWRKITDPHKLVLPGNVTKRA